MKTIKLTLMAFFLVLFAFWPSLSQAFELNVGATLGFQMSSNISLGQSTGTSLFGSLFVQTDVGKDFMIGLGYQGGTSLSKGSGGTAPDITVWKLSGLEIQVSYERPLKDVTPYAALALGRFRIKPEASAPDSRFSIAFIAGFNAELSKSFSGLFELRYAILSFQPEGDRLNLSGFRISIGGALTFDL